MTDMATRIPSAADAIDLTAGAKADALVSDALLLAHRAALTKEVGQLDALADPEARQIVETILKAVARLSAQLDAVQQRLDHATRSRAELIRLDPLPLIAETRRSAAAEVPRQFELRANSPAFQGTGWHNAESKDGFTWRWSGFGPRASVVLPSLGGGRLSLKLVLMLPFQQAFPAEPMLALANDRALELLPTRVQGSGGHFTGIVELPEDDGSGSFALVLQTMTASLTNGRPAHESRHLGLGLHKLILSRIEDGAEASAA